VSTMIENYTPIGKIENRDKRIWSKYNESLVKRAVMLIDTDVFEKWEKYLKLENNGKIGRPYEYPIEFFEFLMKIRALWDVPFRVLESFVRILSKITGKFRPLTYVAIFKRIRKIDVKRMMDEISRSNMNKENMYIIIDSTGFKITDRGEWINNKYNKKRKGWIKVHLAIDANSFNVVSLSITDEKIHDSQEFKKLIDPVLEKTKAVYGDKGYDSKEIYNYLSENGIEAIIPPKKNATTRSRGSPARARLVREIKRIGEEEWKKAVNYGKRWLIEIFFSGLKRVVGEIVRAKKDEYKIQEVIFKIFSYFVMRNYTEV